MKAEGVENAYPVRLIFLDTFDEVHFKSIAYANRITGINEYQIKNGLNPINKKKFQYQGRKCCFRPLKD